MPVCARCGQENPEGSSFCNACGAPLAEPGRTAEERRVVSIVFVDLVGFTARSEQLDPEDVRAILTPYYERVRAELERFGGRVEKFIGDAVMGVFGAPRAFGDDHERAVRAALAVRDWAGEDGLEVRVAVNTGEAIVELEARIGQGEAMIAGDVVNTAARLQSAAPVGAVLVGEDTYLSTRNVIEYQPGFEPVKAKGKAEPVHAWIAVRAGVPAGERPLTRVPMVGRTRQLEVLTGVWERVVAERRPHLVTVFGPAGIGKSRLSLEFMEHVGSQEVACAARTVDAVRLVEPVRRLRAAHEADRAARTTVTSCPRLAPSSTRRSPRSSAPRQRPSMPRTSRCSSGSAKTVTSRTARPSSSRRASSWSPWARRGRRCSCSRTSTGPTPACSTCSRRSPRAFATCRCSSSRSPDRSS